MQNFYKKWFGFEKFTYDYVAVLDNMSEENKVDLPFRAEYAKSGRAKCKGCKSEIPKGDCRLASLTQVNYSQI